MLSRRSFLRSASCAPLLGAVEPLLSGPSLPNIIVILTDDLGFGDVGFNGSKIRTPNLDRLASAGARFNQFYSGDPVCSPSRAALMTGRYPTRVGIPDVIGASDTSDGIPDTETTIAQMLKTVGYATACVGKWHLGSSPQFLPLNHGFDLFYGVPYSNDIYPLPLMYNFDVIETATDNDYLTQKYTSAAMNFINATKGRPFFLYLAHNMPHVPIGASPAFKGKSDLGIYADAVEEMDWSVGQIIQTLDDAGITNNTLSIFTSDNGPWFLGSPGRLRGRKGEAYEGGVREPFAAYMPGTIPAGTSPSGFGSLMDLLPTFAAITGARLPQLPLDGVNIWPMMTGQQDVVGRNLLLYFDSWNIQCARVDGWKLHVARYNAFPWVEPPAEGRINLPLSPPELYHIESDPEEAYECADVHPDIVADIQARIINALPSFPARVQAEWAATRARQTQGTTAGALPIPK